MSTTIEVSNGEFGISILNGETVAVDAMDWEDTVLLFLTPREAVRLSRALVAAAAEALGVAV